MTLAQAHTGRLLDSVTRASSGPTLMGVCLKRADLGLRAGMVHIVLHRAASQGLNRSPVHTREFLRGEGFALKNALNRLLNDVLNTPLKRWWC